MFKVFRVARRCLKSEAQAAKACISSFGENNAPFLCPCVSRFSKLFGKGTFSCFVCHANIINNRSKETGVATARGTAIASLAAAGISCRGGDPSWCHTSLTDLVPIWDIWKCVGGGCPGSCPPFREAGTDHCQLPHARRKVDQGNQVTAEMGCSFAICRRV